MCDNSSNVARKMMVLISVLFGIIRLTKVIYSNYVRYMVTQSFKLQINDKICYYILSGRC